MGEKLSFEGATALIQKYGQEQLLKFFNELAEAEQENLLNQISEVDFDLIKRLYEDIVVKDSVKKLTGEITPIPSTNWDSFSEGEKAELTKSGMELIKEGKVAAFLVAGGQGTRLGHTGPKGTYDIGLPSHKALFQLQAERLLSLARKVGGKLIPWYIMTSKENNDDTINFFKANAYFGYAKEDIFFLMQDLLAVVDSEGKLLLQDKANLSLGPNGNGGCFLALEKSGALKDMEARGIEWIFVYGVDNSLVRVADPAFLGFTVKSGLPVSSKMLLKTDPEEKLGIFCLEDERLTILEYSELEESFRYARDVRGELLYNCGNIVNYFFKLDFLKGAAEVGLPYHVAHKKMKTVDSLGAEVTPSDPNAYKFELFIFDIFSSLKEIAALSINREEEFAPVKNKDGDDSPATARAMISKLHKAWLIKAGFNAESLKGKTVEISPIVSYSGESLNLDIVENCIKSGDILIK